MELSSSDTYKAMLATSNQRTQRLHSQIGVSELQLAPIPTLTEEAMRLKFLPTLTY